MPRRKYTSGSGYRYGFNGKEIDNETVQYDYGFRIYDPRIARFNSVDPLMNSFPWYTPYQFAGNMPICAIDLDGLEEYVVTNYYGKNGKIEETRITILTKKANGKRVNMQLLKQDGSYVTSQNVLIRNIRADGKTSYVHKSSLSAQQNEIVEKAIKELIVSKSSEWAVGFGGGGENGDEGDNIESENKKYNNKYNLTDFSSKKIPKVEPVKKPGVKKSETEDKHLPIEVTSTKEIESEINFWFSSAKPRGGYSTEIQSIINLVQGASNYSIIIYGNIGGAHGAGATMADKTFGLAKMYGYETFGDLALARANAIKARLVEKGLDPSKIQTRTGVVGGGYNANYNVTTPTIK